MDHVNPWIERSACRRCGSALDPSRSNHAEAFAPNSCTACGWINLTTADKLGPTTAALRRIVGQLEQAGFEGLALPETGGTELLLWAKWLRGRLEAWVGKVMYEDPDAAVTWLLSALHDLERQDERAGFSGAPVMVVQFVYLHFLYEHSVPLDSTVVWPLPSFWEKDIFDVSLCWHELCGLLQEAKLGRELTIDDERVVVLVDDEASIWGAEVSENQRKWMPSKDLVGEALVDDYVNQAERIVFGKSLLDLVNVILETVARERKNVVKKERFYWVFLGRYGSEEERDAFARLGLTRWRMSLQMAPDFLYELDGPVLRDTATAMDASGGMDWFTFAPIIFGYRRDESEEIPVAIVSNYLMNKAILKSYTGASRRLAAAEQVSKKSGSQTARAVAKLSRQFHERLERSVAKTLTESGMRAVQGLEKVGGLRLAHECGEIDVVAGGPSICGEFIIFVCEVKNTDLGFFKGHGPGEAFRVAQRAHKQAQRKANWVKQHLPQVWPLLNESNQGPPAKVRVVALTIPRITPMPVGGHAASIPLPELAEVAVSVLGAPVAAWRPDLQRALVDAGTDPG